MYRLITFVAFFFLILCVNCTSTKRNIGSKNVLPASALEVTGRYSMANEKVDLISSAVHFGFTFQGDECKILASLPNKQEHNYLQYELDGAYQKRVRINGSDTEPIVITAHGEGVHEVWIYKATEAHTGAISIEKLSVKV